MLQRLRSLGKLDLASALGPLLSFLTLSTVVYFFYLFYQMPEVGFILDGETGEVLNVTQPCETTEICLQVGDRILQLGDIRFEEYRTDRTVAIYRAFDSGAPVAIRLRRGDESLELLHRALAENREPLASLSTLFFPGLFWFMGTIAVLFLRPRDHRWLVLVLFLYVTALWVSAGFLSFSQEAYSAIVYDASLLLFLPLSIHLHLVLPDSPFKKYHPWVLPPLYVFAVALFVLNQMNLIPRFIRLAWALAAMTISLVLLIIRRLVPAPAATQVANRAMLYGVGLGLGPIILMVALYMIDPAGLLASSYITVAVMLVLLVSPLWPITYIYAIYKHDLGAFEFRASRLLGVYGFFSLYITTYIIVFKAMADWWLSRDLDVAVLGLALSVVFVAVGPLAYSRFQSLVDRRIFGIKYRPDEVVTAFAERIPTASNRGILKRIIVDEILPTLLIRESALYVLDDDAIEVIYEKGLTRGAESLQERDIRELASRAGTYISTTADLEAEHRWVRVAVPLSILDHTIGVWLLGKRDPDDYYTKSDVVLLGNLANQIAPVIENFRLVETACQEVAENKRLQEQLIHSQKMEAIGRLSAGVAHDFNNILSVIIGYSNLILAQYRDDETLQQSIKNIQDAGERAAGLTKQLLAFSRQQVMEPRVTDVNAIVADVEKMLRRLAGEDIELITDLSSDLPQIKIDPGQMGQVIINLAVNARDAMPDGGRIRIETRRAECRSSGESLRRGVPPGIYVLLRVEDTGPGIEPEIQARMFEPYFTTKDLGKGTGLGLSMVYGIVNQSNGFIFVDSRVGEGAVFSVYLPAVTRAEVDNERFAGTRTMMHPGTETILLVEDEQSVRAVASEILRSSGYDVVESRDGEEALKDFKRRQEDIDLLLTDVIMPRMKGPELAERLVEIEPDLKVIYMSGYNDEAILERELGHQETVLIQKPFTPQTLARKVREVLDGVTTARRGPAAFGR